MISEASHDVWRLLLASRDLQRVTEMRRQRIRAIDAFISMLEERHLDGDRTLDRLLRLRLRRLEREVGMPLPRKAVRARNSVRLHAALLDWQETVFDAVVPERLAFPDIHDSDWSTPHPVGW